jgi:lysophospholipase L1-like esterase
VIIKANDTILFQGDSITDAGRAKGSGDATLPANDIHALGTGYAAKAAGMLLAQHAGEDLQIHNRGNSGNRVTDMRDRWQADCLDIKPDVLSILIGVNDTWHGIAKGTPDNGVNLDMFERILRELITTTRAALPDLRLVICEPFTTEAGAVLELNFHPDIDDRRAIIRAIADDEADVFVPFQELFDTLCTQAPPESWAHDGVHPSPAGHQRMAEFWMQCVEPS